ncbi:hypothetical protein DYB37_004397 [Aphanomyces astaci]|uniref:Uncharacterized protein n=1 Tax=Aphanomyces astaci TaxID=112090 RepID=A0A418EJG4_APHAT|nr:hypothetical protein DYB35_002348 [Aphanomyces astaci]RHZ14218.1 hypothetical protein DYB37_004397 [Aphanomyces astaci]
MSNHLVRCVKRGNHLHDHIDHQEGLAASHHTSVVRIAGGGVRGAHSSASASTQNVGFQACISFRSTTGAPVKASRGSLRVGEGPASRFRVLPGPWSSCSSSAEALTRHDRVALQLVSTDPEDADAFLASAPAPLHGPDAKIVTLTGAAWDDEKRDEFAPTAHLFAAFAWELHPVRTDERLLCDGTRLQLVQEHGQEVFEVVASVGPQDLTMRRRIPSKTMHGTKKSPTTGGLTVVLKLHDTDQNKSNNRQQGPTRLPPEKRKPWLVEALANLKDQVANNEQAKQAFHRDMQKNMAAYAASHSLDTAREEAASEDYYGRKLKTKPKVKLRSKSVLAFVQTFHRIKQHHSRRDESPPPELTDRDRLRLMQCYNPQVYGRVGNPAVLSKSSRSMKTLVDGMERIGEAPPTPLLASSSASTAPTTQGNKSTAAPEYFPQPRP